jgi:hypothetical protein
MPPGSNGPCDPEGATRPCHAPLVPNHDGIVMCFDGMQTCTAGVWGTCDGPSAPRPIGQAPDSGGPDATVGVPPPPNPSGDSAAIRLADSTHALALLPLASSLVARPKRAQDARARRDDPSAATRSTKPTSPLANALALRFEIANGEVHAIFPPDAHSAASVHLPRTADGFVRIDEGRSSVGARFRLLGASQAPIAPSGGIAVYPNALAAAPGAHVFHRVSGEGTEDFVYFTSRPDVEELRYEVDVSRAAGLRFVSNTLELLDAEGTPRIRVAPPSFVDARGIEHGAALSVEGCAFDASPVASWGRAVTRPGASSCTVRVGWSADAYPILVDPTWTATGSMATGRDEHTMSRLGTGVMIVVGGRNGAATTYHSSAELYDPTTRTFGATGAMSTARGQHFAAPFGSGTGLVLVAGGLNTGGTLSAAEVYDATTGQFTNVGAMAIPRSSARGTVLTTTSNVLVTGGLNALNTPVATAEIFDSTVRAFTPTGPMLFARAYHTALEIVPGTVLVAGGFDGTNNLATAALYTESTGTFAATTGLMINARARHTATQLTAGGKVLLTGGWTSATNVSLATAELYDPATKTFAATGSMAVARGYHAARLLPTGKVVVAGGLVNVATNATASAESYDPALGTFSALGNMTVAREYHASGNLASGVAFVAGGDNGTGIAATSAEILATSAGQACTLPADCTSGQCEEGICCATACSGTCKTCAVGTGACTTVTSGPDPDSCPAPSACNAAGSCIPGAADAGGAVACSNPCDPTCRVFPVDAGTLSPETGGGYFGSTSGLGGSPPGFISKELCNPCTGPFPQSCGGFTHYSIYDSCASDYHCNTTTAQCVRSAPGWTWPPAVCPGVDLTVQGSCGAGFPMCNRGNTALAAGAVVSIYTVNGNQWSNDPTCLTNYPTSCTFTLPTALAPGTCQTVDTCSWNGNTVAFVNSNHAIAECPLPGPACGDNWADIKSGGACVPIQTLVPTVTTQTYVGSCPAGTHVQWGALTYSTTVANNASGNSDVTFKAQTAPTLLDGGTGTFGSYVTLADAVVTDPAVCQAPCAIDMYTKLGGKPAATNEVLNLQFTVSPTPDQQAGGSLNSYQVTFSCPPSE